MNYRSIIENTQAYKDLPVFKKNIWQSSSNMRVLTDHYIKAKTIGYDEWKQSNHPSQVEDSIIKELLSNHHEATTG